MAPIGVIIFISLIIAIPLIGGGIYSCKHNDNKTNGHIMISVGIGISIAILMWGINRSNCMNGDRGYGKKSMDYNNGKISYYTPRSRRAIYCDDEEGYNVGYVFKWSIIISGLTGMIIFGIDYAKAKKNHKDTTSINDETTLTSNKENPTNNKKGKVNNKIKSKLPKYCSYCNKPLMYSQNADEAISLFCTNKKCLKYNEKFCPKCGNMLRDNICDKCKSKK